MNIERYKIIAREIDFVDGIMSTRFDDYGEETHRALKEAEEIIDSLSAVPEGEKGIENYGKLMTINQQLAFENEELRERLSAVPERSKGHWIPVYGKNGKTIMSYKCSKCMFHPKHAIITDFCGGCGADMRGINK